MTTLAIENPETMASMTIVTPALAGRGARLGAALLDLLIFSVFLIPGFWIIGETVTAATANPVQRSLARSD